ncbi:hypothetical protein P168DRAFT_44536 [Aspergillus campestris IBT 28561]|uniref:Zn(2)-C6 fungal-type domain-containing protein n=1 Tax=Aspergillus campestris (strain IBT 28561) TaxID=1392248 RepID=A0A2I1CXE2_ASPC2|nr:uncharacterized protein P168DRAFT_44536 [Aspergillus campestris IBT 28561]PKY02299.1 hypothetical protein P168DRAFT_44536 [Aspergillus campestris IBT 28561]
MENIKIPSPSAILDPLPPLASSSRKLSLSASTSTRKTASSQAPVSGVTNKPKQSKSRNGCITCKTKRLKCDESKPTCLQCKKRNVECGGYKKDFKWRPFEETNVAGKVATAKPQRTTSSRCGNGNISLSTAQPTRLASVNQPRAAKPSHLRRLSASTHGRVPGLEGSRGHSKRHSVAQDSFPFPADGLDDPRLGSFKDDAPIPLLPEIIPSDPCPWLSNLSPPGVELGMSSDQSTLGSSAEESTPASESFSFSALLEGEHDDIDEIIRQSAAPATLDTPTTDLTSTVSTMPTVPSFLTEPIFSTGSPELLVIQFDRFTCGILSVKDGVHENPWRTLVWPLAKDTPALYHAIFALAAFHSSKQNPAQRVHGVDHMRQSITHMVQDIQNMRADAALATSLALAFADTWDQHTRTCIQHLRGAKALVSQVVRYGLQSGITGQDLERVRFLYNTWLYMDVIAHLTSREGCGDQNVNVSILQHPRDAVHEIDPLMGCATTLFPLIDRVARLIQRARKMQSNSISLVSHAIELKRLVEQWEPPAWFEPPEDPTSEVQHSIQIAHAYRWATLLYLHQAVPEMPSEPASDLAKRVLILLATVPPSSRTTIIQMFPLLAAGCETDQEEDRQWVLNRWTAVQSRLMLGSIDRCIEVVREVWARRDAFEAEKQRRQFCISGRASFSACDGLGKDGLSYGSLSTADDWASVRSAVGSSSRRNSVASPLENIEFEKTIRGRLHWLTVMREWGWEVFLG